MWYGGKQHFKMFCPCSPTEEGIETALLKASDYLTNVMLPEKRRYLAKHQ